MDINGTSLLKDFLDKAGILMSQFLSGGSSNDVIPARPFERFERWIAENKNKILEEGESFTCSYSHVGLCQNNGYANVQQKSYNGTSVSKPYGSQFLHNRLELDRTNILVTG